jgi:hypothetical protein
VSNSTDVPTYSAGELDGKCNSAHVSGADFSLEEDVGTPGSINLDGDVDMESYSDDEVEKEKEDEDEQEEQEKEEDENEEEDEDEQEDENENDSKEPSTIDQGEKVMTFTDNLDTMVDYQPILLPV